MGVSGNIVDAARATGQASQNVNQQQTEANRPNQSNAWGTTRYNRYIPTDAEGNNMVDPITGMPITQWEQTESLVDPLQNSLDSQMNIQEGRSNLAQGMMGRVWDTYQNPMDFGQYGDVQQLEDRSQFDYDFGAQRQAAEDAAYQRSTNRLDPQFQQQEQALMSRLRNQGLAAGDQAYDAAIGNFNIGRNDAYEQARLGATGEGRTEADQMYNQALQQNTTNFGQGVQQNQMANALRSQAMNEGVAQRGFGLNEMNNMLSGQLVQGGPPSSGGQTETGQPVQQNSPFNVSVAG